MARPDTVWGVDLSVIFLGTGGSVPTARRATACVLARVGGARIMFDCGEGSQRQMQRSTGLVQLDEIYLTHYHADHYLGLPGLLKTYDLQARERPLRIVGPRGLHGMFAVLGRIFGKLSYDVELVELAEGDAVRHEGFEVRCFEVEHRTRALGYALVEDERPGRFDPEAPTPPGRPGGPRLQPTEGGRASEGLRRSRLTGPGDGRSPPRAQGRHQRGHRPVRDDAGRRARGRAPRARRQLPRRGGRASRRDRSLHGQAGRRAGRRGGRE